MAFSDVVPDGVVTVDGFEIEYRFELDNDNGPPWANPEEDAPLMRYASRYRIFDNTKRSYERPLADGHGGTYFFNWKLAAERARVEKWNTPPYDAPNRIERAVQSLYDYYKSYINDDWHYVGIEVRLVRHPQYRHDVWGFETYKDYHKESVMEMASELVSMYLNDIEKGKYLPREDNDD